jgi:hypothetical protein
MEPISIFCSLFHRDVKAPNTQTHSSQAPVHQPVGDIENILVGFVGGMLKSQ